MADNRPPLPSSNITDPFADRLRQTQFSEPERPYHTARAYESTTTLNHQYNHGQDNYDDDEYIEKQPLNVGQSGFSGGFYPPGCVATPAPSSTAYADTLRTTDPLTLAILVIHTFTLVVVLIQLPPRPVVSKALGGVVRPSNAV